MSLSSLCFLYTYEMPKLKRNNYHSKLTWVAYVATAIVLLPIASLLLISIFGDFSEWSHLLRYSLPNTALNTVLLLIGVAIFVGAVGTGAAWLTAAYIFPTRNILIWAMLLPLSVPSYIMAFSYLDLTHTLGPIQSTIRDILGYSSPRDFRLPDIRDMGIFGAVIVLGLSLYSYVYLSVRVMFMSQSANLIEAARTLGCSPSRAFMRVMLPMARPAIAVGISLALLETLNDIGASEFLGIQTMTVSIYTEWTTKHNMQAAAQIAMVMLAVVTVILYIERISRNRQRYSNTQKLKPIEPVRLHGYKALLAMFFGWLPIIVGFFFPASYLIYETYIRIGNYGRVSSDLFDATFNTFILASIATVITVCLGLLIAWVVRNPRYKFGKILVRLATIGYAVPASVISIGLIYPLGHIDDFISSVIEYFTSAPPQLYITGSIAGLVIIYVIRFLLISTGGLEAGLSRIPISLDNAASSLGMKSNRTFFKVHLPLLKPALGSAALLVFVDSMKELSATLLLRPLSFETLSTWLYAEAARETYEEGAIAALLIVLVGILPVIFLARPHLRHAINDHE
ncbi:ABC transporter membrane protein [Taylorella equigenitalis 14/56]|uniref:ABC transporter membrane protein n=2 Tax=Taylorella equigenitalis TaxID=29575 RepID=I7JNG9_9BURK|nr:iron ABC transporter permease [Taylorella equigenitalis]CCG17560.1 ABC transporter membrane protein [Taylorella equigenitalis 14/56]